jgi:spore maturation protein CgeB
MVRLGIELFLKPDEEILLARDGQDVVDILGSLSAERARRIGAAALARVLSEHTYQRRAKLADEIFRSLARRSVAEAAE